MATLALVAGMLALHGNTYQPRLQLNLPGRVLHEPRSRLTDLEEDVAVRVTVIGMLRVMG